MVPLKSKDEQDGCPSCLGLKYSRESPWRTVHELQPHAQRSEGCLTGRREVSNGMRQASSSQSK